MRAPQIIYIIVWAMGLGVSLVNHGKVEFKRESFWKTLLGTAIEVCLLIWGGFFG